MPTLERIHAFIQRVEAQDYVGAIADFYHADATMQENLGAIRAGRDALIAHEIDSLSRFGIIHTRKLERFAEQGDTVFINWVFEFRRPSGGVRVLDEIAVQTWRDDRIQTERFYYDPAQLRD